VCWDIYSVIIARQHTQKTVTGFMQTRTKTQQLRTNVAKMTITGRLGMEQSEPFYVNARVAQLRS
jgi:hypothetical protein